jgi:hypothetical protein
LRCSPRCSFESNEAAEKTISSATRMILFIASAVQKTARLYLGLVV